MDDKDGKKVEGWAQRTDVFWGGGAPSQICPLGPIVSFFSPVHTTVIGPLSPLSLVSLVNLPSV